MQIVLMPGARLFTLRKQSAAQEFKYDIINQINVLCYFLRLIEINNTLLTFWIYIFSKGVRLISSSKKIIIT